MSIKKIGVVVCSIAILSGCITGTQATNQFYNRVKANEIAQEEMTISGRAEPLQEVIVSSSIEGKIKTMLVDLGSYVTQGQKLAELDEGELLARVKQAEDQVKVVEAQGNLTAMEQQIALNQTMASINQAMVGLNTSLPPEAPQLPEMSGFPELEAAKTEVQDAELALSEITKEWGTINELYNNGLVSKQELDSVASAKSKAEIELERSKKRVETETSKVNIQQKYEEEKAKYEEEKAKYEREKAKFDKEAGQASTQTEKSARETMNLQKQSLAVTTQMTQIAIENANAELEAIRSELNNLTMVAPVNGFITQKIGRIGEMVTPGNPIFMITNLDKLYISINVPESMINKWKENQQVKVSIPTQEINVDGTVAFIGVIPNENEQSYPVKVLIDNSDHKIKGGMTAVVTWKEKNEDIK